MRPRNVGVVEVPADILAAADDQRLVVVDPQHTAFVLAGDHLQCVRHGKSLTSDWTKRPPEPKVTDSTPVEIRGQSKAKVKKERQESLGAAGRSQKKRRGSDSPTYG